jgi:hypothetical protein
LAVVVGIDAPAGEDHDVRHEAMPRVALAHQHLGTGEADAPEYQAGGVARAGGAAREAFRIGAAGIVGGRVSQARSP